MMIRIVLPDGDGPKVANGTKVYDEDTGAEIRGVSRIQIDMVFNGIIEAHLTVPVAAIDGLTGVVAAFDTPKLNWWGRLKAIFNA